LSLPEGVIILQILANFFEQHLVNTVVFHVSEFQNGGFVQQAIQFQAGKVPHGFDFEKGVIYGRIIADFETYSESS